eukprot:SAG11_NODE_3359_length_2501_cov_1.511657_2_plen_186_part_00
MVGEQGQRIKALLESIDSRVKRLETNATRVFHWAEKTANAENSENAKNEIEYDFTSEQIQVFRAAFDNFDADNSGAIDASEMGDVCKTLEEPVGEKLLAEIVDEVDVNNDGVVDFPEFLGLMHRLMAVEDGNRSKVKVKKISHYGRDALLRWIRDDPEELEGDVTGPEIGGLKKVSSARFDGQKV